MAVHLLLVCSDRPDPPAGKPLVSEVCGDSARVSWQAPAHDGGAVITAYIIEKCERGGGGSGGKRGGGKWLKCGSTHLTNMQIHRLKVNTQTSSHLHVTAFNIIILIHHPNLTTNHLII
jgi:hypothetical protein